MHQEKSLHFGVSTRLPQDWKVFRLVRWMVLRRYSEVRFFFILVQAFHLSGRFEIIHHLSVHGHGRAGVSGCIGLYIKGKSSLLEAAATGWGSGIGAADYSVRERHSVVNRSLLWSLLVSSLTLHSLNLGNETAACNASLSRGKSTFDCSHNKFQAVRWTFVIGHVSLPGFWPLELLALVEAFHKSVLTLQNVQCDCERLHNGTIFFEKLVFPVYHWLIEALWCNCGIAGLCPQCWTFAYSTMIHSPQLWIRYQPFINLIVHN